MVNVNSERRRPLGAVTNLPLRIHDCIILMDAIVTDANSYSAIVRNDWLRKTKAILDYNNNLMTIEWNGQALEVVTECREMPHHIISIEIPNMEVEEEAKKADEISDEEINEELEAIDDSEEKYESEDENAQEQLFCHMQFVTKEKAQEIEKDLKGNTFIKNDYYYQYKEIEKGKFHTGDLDDTQRQKFQDFMNHHQKLFAWKPDDFGRTSIVTHCIDTGNAVSIKQRLY
jgi:hypothetical protein